MGILKVQLCLYLPLEPSFFVGQNLELATVKRHAQ